MVQFTNVHMHHCYDISKPNNAYDIRGLGQHWFKQWLVAWQGQTTTLINAGIFKNKPQWNFNQNTFLSFNQMHLKTWSANWQPLSSGSVGPFWLSAVSLQWRHNERDGVTNHQRHNCLLNHLFRRRSKKTSKLRGTGLCAGNSPGPVNSPHKGPITQKLFPFYDVIM